MLLGLTIIQMILIIVLVISAIVVGTYLSKEWKKLSRPKYCDCLEPLKMKNAYLNWTCQYCNRPINVEKQ